MTKIIAAACVAAMIAPFSATAQTITAPPQPAAIAPQAGVIFAAPPAASPPIATAARVIHIPEGTPVKIRFEETITSKTAKAGDEFAVSLDEPIQLDNGVVIPATFKGVGEVMSAERHGFVGKAGQLNVQLDYIKVGDKRLHLRSHQGGEGKGSLGAAVALTVLFGPLGLLARGADITIPAGQKVTAYVETDTDIVLPTSTPYSALVSH